jgi:putative lipoic acid-binding regulatory protein
MDNINKNSTFKDLINFPVDYEFKIIGKSDRLDIEYIAGQIEEIIKRNLSREGIRKRESTKKTYSSYSVKVYLEEYNELEKIYEFLKSQETISYYL